MYHKKRITEHALLRYVERVVGISPVDLAEKAYPVAAWKQAKQLDGLIPIVGDDGDTTHKLLVRKGVAITVFTPDMLIKRIAQAKKRRGHHAEGPRPEDVWHPEDI